MDRDTVDLIAQLCTRAGMLMEDASAEALTVGALPPDQVTRVVDQLSDAIAKCAAYLVAARSLAGK